MFQAGQQVPDLICRKHKAAFPPETQKMGRVNTPLVHKTPNRTNKIFSTITAPKLFIL